MNPTGAAKKREKGGVVKADVEGKLALGRVHQGGVGQAHLRFALFIFLEEKKSIKFQERFLLIMLSVVHLNRQAVLGLVAKTIPWVPSPSPARRVLYRVGRKLGPKTELCDRKQKRTSRFFSLQFNRCWSC